MKSLVKKARTSQAVKDLTAAFSALDKAAKVHLIHPNKAARLKSRLTKGVTTSAKTAVKKSPKKSPKK